MSSEQLLWAGHSERVGANKLLYARRRVEHWIKNHQVERTRSADFEANNSKRVSLVLKVDGRLVCHVYLLVEFEQVVTTKILTYGQEKAFMCCELAVVGEGVGFTPGRRISNSVEAWLWSSHGIARLLNSA